jgi:hypothetical protein
MRRTHTLPLTLLVACTLTIAAATASLWAMPEADLLCCSPEGDCGAKKYCCPPTTEVRCNETGEPNYCMDACIWPR